MASRATLMPNARGTLKARVAEYSRHRDGRVGRTWEQFREAVWRHEGELIPDVDDMQRRLSVMRQWLRVRPLAGWTIASALAADDIGAVDHLVVLAPPTPTTAVPGTPEKLAVLAARAESGEELWHPADGAGSLD